MDYADCFAVDVAVERSPVEWVRQCATQMPRLFSAIRVAHRALGLHVGTDDENHLIGWEIVHSQSTEGVLANEGLLGCPRIVGITSPGHIAVATLIELNGARGRAL